MLFVLLAFLSRVALAEPCPKYEGAFPTTLVDVSEFKFFYYPREATIEDPDIVLVEKNGTLFDRQKVYFWADDLADESALFNKDIDISYTHGLDFIGVTFRDRYGVNHEYLKGECRGVNHPLRALHCD